MNTILEDTISKLKFKLISLFDPHAILLIGSAAQELDFKDIDIVVILKESILMNVEKIKSKINKIIDLELTKISDCILISDRENPRIEIKLKYGSTEFDLTFIDFSININKFKKDILYDNLELYIGNIYVHSKVIYQKTEIYQKHRSQFLPYYDDNLYRIRMAIIKNKLIDLILKLDFTPSDDKMTQINLLDNIIKLLIQLRFMQFKMYPLSYDKRINYQFKTYLNDSKFVDILNEKLNAFLLQKADKSELISYLNEIIT